jgi:hypothetical protein
MPNDALEILPWLRSIERLFADFNVNDSLKVHLLKPHLTEHARNLIARMDPDKASNYADVKQLLLHEFKLSSSALLDRFNGLNRNTSETFTLYGNRLKSVLSYYVESRKVEDYDSLIELLICDRIKSQLTEGALRYMLSLENQSDDGWLHLDKLVESLDIYYTTHSAFDRPRYTQTAVYGSKQRPPRPPPSVRNNSVSVKNSTPANKTTDDKPSRKRCFTCGSDQHLANFHSRNASKPTNGADSKPARVYSCKADRNVEAESQSSATSAIASENVVSSPTGSQAACNQVVVHDTVCQANAVCDEAKSVDPSTMLAPLDYIDVRLSDGQNNLITRGLCDSGAQLSVARADAVSQLNLHAIAQVRIRGIVGDPVEAQVVMIDMRLATCSDQCEPVSVHCALSDNLNDQLILASHVVNQLTHHSCCRDVCVRAVHSTRGDSSDGGGDGADSGDGSEDVQDDEGGLDQSEDTEVGGDTGPTDHAADATDSVGDVSDSGKADVVTLREEQGQDETLRPCFSLARQDKGGFYCKDGLLYRREVIVGQLTEQLVLPVARRAHVLKLAHDTCGAHMGVHNTKQRIRLSFYWPTLARDVKTYVASCRTCSLRRRRTCFDNVPIRPIERNETSFNHWYCDMLGPLFPNEKVEFNYCFVACDSKTRFPVAYPMRSVTARNVCDCLLKIWMLFGVSQFVTLDNASCNTAHVTKLLMEKLGCSPIFITPTHSQANGLAERTVGSLKEFIHKVAYDHKRSWYKYLDFILWAMREVPQSSTQVAPWQMAFGFLPRGPCAILKDSWTGVKTLPLDLEKPVANYLCELRDKLSKANDYAAEHMQSAQQKWVSRYNLRSKDKKFEVGEQVLVLTPDSTSSRIWSRWRAPATVVEVKSPYSYIVEIDGARMHVHANKLRKYDVRVDEIICNCLSLCTVDVNSSSVIFDCDEEFGHVEEFTSTHDTNSTVLLPSQFIDPSRLSHLSESQRNRLLAVLDRYPECFLDKPGLCDFMEQEIHVTLDFKPRRLKEYRVPEKFKPEIDRQIQELLRLGLIHESTSPQASPIVCVLKGKDGSRGVRLTVDYRYVNRYTIADALGPPDMHSVMQRIGRARYISTFDGRSSYWTIRVKREHQWLTAFIYDSQLYEWSRVPFGLKNSGCSFVRMIQRVLHPIREFTESFVDDMAVFSDDFDQHLNNLERYLNVIKKSGLTLNLAKSNFAKPEVKFCGHFIGSGRRRIDPEKVEAVEKLKRPETKAEVRQALGLFGWFRDYLPQYAEHALPLTELTAKRVPNLVPWGARQQAAFDKLKRMLCDAACQPLHIIEWGKPFNVFSDASAYCAAGILSQTDDQGKERPIAFYSRKFNDTQRAWSTIEREAFAVLEAVKRFYHWIFGYEIHVFSDHNPLAYLTDAAPKSAKLLRWSLALQNFNLHFHYKAGKTPAMAAPDCLSRLGSEMNGDEMSA